MNLTEKELTTAFYSAFFKRGKAYFKKGAVLAFEIIHARDNYARLRGSVEGSRTRYSQKITLFRENNHVKVDGSCTCPVDHNCKHVVAVCLQYQQTIFVKDEPSKDTSLVWLDAFSHSFQEDRGSITDDDDFLVYLLRHVQGTIKVRLHKTKRLKRGGLSKGKSLEFSETRMNVEYYSSPRYIQTEDMEVIKLLGITSGPYSSEATLEGQSGFLAMQQMLASGRSYWDDYDNPPLSEGDAREFSCEWETNQQGDAQLKLRIRPDAILMPTEPALYCDKTSYQVGTFNEMPYTTEQLKMLMEAPAIPTSAVDEFSQRVALSLPQRVFSPPKPVLIERIEGLEPQAHVRLQRLEVEGEYHRLARLRFVYGAHELSLFPQEDESQLSIQNKIISIVRNTSKEASIFNVLKEYGMVSGEIEGSHKDAYFLFDEMNEMKSDALWFGFINQTMPELQEKGWIIDIDHDFEMEFHEVDAWHADIEESDNDWFNLSFDIEINQEKRPLLPLVTQVLEHYDLEDLPETLLVKLEDGKYLQLPRDQIKPILDILYELYDREGLSHDGTISMSRLDAARLSDLDQNNSALQWQGGKQLRELGQRLKDFSGIEVVEPPKGLQAELRDYQQQGLNWLQFLCNYQLNGILADDMGLGKTVQALAHLLLEKEQGRLTQPCLIVAPTSLMGNWRREAAVFAPDLKVLVLQGSDRAQHFESINDYDVILSTYPLLVRDEEVLLKHEFHIIILDEAQVVKNPKSKAARVIRQLKTSHRLCLTGTPMENHLGELWALFDFLMPGFLGDSKQFNSLFRTPIEKHGDSGMQQRLVKRIKPFMLRRTKSEVASELPDKTEITRTVTLGQKQAALYESIRLSMEAKVRDTIAHKGLARSHIIILDALLKLRQVCCDPRILSLKQAKKVEESAKLELLMEMVPKMLEEGRRILIFSQFTKMLALIEDEMKSHSIRYSKLTGQTRKRDEAIDMFKQGDADVFLISLKAGGVGLNLTEADSVIHYDPWWNPAAENQATDRVHRIGQDKAVFVYKLVVENSVEEKIIAMQEKKKALADAVYETGADKRATAMTAHDMEALFAPL